VSRQERFLSGKFQFVEQSPDFVSEAVGVLDVGLQLVLESLQDLFDGLEVGGRQDEDLVGLANDQTLEGGIRLSLKLEKYKLITMLILGILFKSS
jgi:hypothetical protein